MDKKVKHIDKYLEYIKDCSENDMSKELRKNKKKLYELIEKVLFFLPKNFRTIVKAAVHIIFEHDKNVMEACSIDSITPIIISMFYLLMPIDAIPDFIPSIGFLDDIAVIAYLLGKISGYLECYARHVGIN